MTRRVNISSSVLFSQFFLRNPYVHRMRFLARRHLRFATLTLLVVSGAFLISACDTTTKTDVEPRPTNYDVTGDVTGRVVDAGTNDPISGAEVSIDALTAEGADSLVTTTDENGEFAFANVPAQSSEAQDEAASGNYSIHVNASGADGEYPDNVRAEATLSFGAGTDGEGSDGEDGDANNLGASVTIPLPELTASVSGSAFVEDTDKVGASGIPVALVREGGYNFDADGSVDAVDVEVATDTTGSSGNFSFSNVPEGLDASAYRLEWDLGDNTLTQSSSNIPTAAKKIPFEAGASVELGELELTTAVNNNLPFHVTNGPLTAGNTPDGLPIDLDSKNPSITFTFNRALAQNDFTTEANLESKLNINFVGRKALDTGGDPTVDVTVSGNTMTVSPSEDLDDGTKYELNGLSSIFSSSDFVGARFAQTEDEAPSASNLPDYDNVSTLNFTIGQNTSKPAAPSIVVEEITSSGKPDSLDWTDSELTIEHRIVNNASIELCDDDLNRSESQDCNAIELFVSKKGEPFERAAVVEGDASNFEFGEVDLAPTIDSSPFQDDENGDTYTPVKVYATVTSLNGVTSDKTSVITLHDNESLEVTGASYEDEDGDGDIDVLEVDFDEPISESTVALSDFDVIDAGAGVSNDIDNVNRINNKTGGATVFLNVPESGDNNPADDEVVVDGINDLSGRNGVNGNSDRVSIVDNS